MLNLAKIRPAVRLANNPDSVPQNDETKRLAARYLAKLISQPAI